MFHYGLYSYQYKIITLSMDNFLSLLADAGGCIKPTDGDKVLSLQSACGNILLHMAISGGNERDVSNLLKLGISANVRQDGVTPLNQAVYFGYADIIELLVEGGADIYQKTASGETLLQLAVLKGNTDAVNCLLNMGLEVDVKDKEGLTPLYRAAERDDLDTAEELFDYGADIFTDSGETLVHVAVSRNCVNAIRCLADLGIDLDTVDSETCTPVYRAAEAGNLNMIKELEANGANILIQDGDGHSLLHIAAREGNLTATRTLLEAGIDVNIKGGWWNWTPLHVAAGSGNLAIAKLLIQMNATVDMKTSDGRTPLYLAKCNNDTVMISCLMEKTSK